MTVTMECPWCDETVALHDEVDLVVCEACGVVADLAPDRLAELARAA